MRVNHIVHGWVWGEGNRGAEDAVRPSAVAYKRVEDDGPPETWTLEGEVGNSTLDKLTFVVAFTALACIAALHFVVVVVRKGVQLLHVHPLSDRGLELQAQVVDNLGVSVAMVGFMLYCGQAYGVQMRDKDALSWWRVTPTELLSRRRGGPILRRAWKDLTWSEIHWINRRKAWMVARGLVERATGRSLEAPGMLKEGLILAFVIGPFGYLFAEFGPLQAAPRTGSFWFLNCLLYGAFLIVPSLIDRRRRSTDEGVLAELGW